MRFTKMQGAGNDFIIIDDRDGSVPVDALGGLARQVCARRLSLGADGLMAVVNAENGGDFKMLFYNNDGTEGEMCGNGARCISRYGHEKGLASGDSVRVETVSGTVVGHRVSETEYTVRLNSPTLIDLDRSVQGESVSYIELGHPGHPHCIVVKDFEAVPEEKLRELGRSLRWDPSFPKGANVTFVKPVGEDEVAARTFERGVEDFTLACGTGSGATVCALTLKGLVSGKNVTLHVPGGNLRVSVIPEGEELGLYLTGPTKIVAEGELFL